MTAYDPALIERLVAEAREDERMLMAFREFGDSHLIRAASEDTYGTYAVVKSMERAQRMADQLEAARREVERLQTRPLLQLVKKISGERDHLRSLIVDCQAYRDTLVRERDESLAFDRRRVTELDVATAERDALRADLADRDASIVQLMAQRDEDRRRHEAMRAEVGRLREVARTAGVVRNLRLAVDSRLTPQERRIFDDLSEVYDAWKFP